MNGCSPRQVHLHDSRCTTRDRDSALLGNAVKPFVLKHERARLLRSERPIGRAMKSITRVRASTSVRLTVEASGCMQIEKTRSLFTSGSFWEVELGQGVRYGLREGVQSDPRCSVSRLVRWMSTSSGSHSSGSPGVRQAAWRTRGLRTRTVLGDFAVGARGFQIAHKAVTMSGRTAGKPWFGRMTSPRQRRDSQRRCGPSDIGSSSGCLRRQFFWLAKIALNVAALRCPRHSSSSGIRGYKDAPWAHVRRGRVTDGDEVRHRPGASATDIASKGTWAMPTRSSAPCP
jgi:hypothetical protein